jgi:hypothetical protein
VAVDDAGETPVERCNDTRAVMAALQALVAFVDEFYILAVVFLDSSTRFSE